MRTRAKIAAAMMSRLRVIRFMGLDSKFLEKVFVAFDGGLEASDDLCATDTVPVVTIAAIGLRFRESADEDREPAVRESDQVMQCFVHGYRLGERGERVKRIFAFSFERE